MSISDSAAGVKVKMFFVDRICFIVIGEYFKWSQVTIFPKLQRLRVSGKKYP